MDERRYSESEIEEIFEQALAPGGSGSRALDRDGLTLPELQEIGREVGISPERVAMAAESLDRFPPTRPSTGRVVGLPLSVAHTVSLPRQPTDAEWEGLVADLRRTFAAAGRIDTHGSLRLWSNGNLHASVEPGEDGPVLRMGTVKGSARQLLLMGGPMVLAGVIFMLIFVLGLAGNPDWLEVGAILSVAGAGMLGYAALPLQSWARQRQRQMEEVGERTVRALASPDGD